VAAKVLYIYRSADDAFTCIQKRSYGIELSVFYHQNYHGRREHLRQYGVVESVGKVFGLHPQCLEAECSGSGPARTQREPKSTRSRPASGPPACCKTTAGRETAKIDRHEAEALDHALD
jgi:hypothetical protein